MKVLDPGHLYELANLDTHDPGNRVERIQFVKRIGDKFPGNEPPACAGTITQEVIRVLIDRTQYVNGQQSDIANEQAIAAFRQALRVLEMRAARERGDFHALLRIVDMQTPETEPTCEHCGHVLCRREHGEGP